MREKSESYRILSPKRFASRDKKALVAYEAVQGMPVKN